MSKKQQQKQNQNQNQKQFPKIGNVHLQRIPCNCVAQKHPLINNCLNCGKVICALEGEGPCFFCGNKVTKPDTQYVDRNDASLFPSMEVQQLKKISIQRSNARKHKNILVQRDNTAGIVQNIYDQQMDYYQLSQNQWAKQEDRKFAVQRILLQQKHIEDQKSINRVYFDHATNQWIKQDFKYDQEGFKKQAQEYILQAQTKQIVKGKEKNIQKHQGADIRLKNNEKTSEVYEQIKKQLWIQQPKKNKVKEIPKFKGELDIIIEK